MFITRKNLLKTSILFPFLISCNKYSKTEGIYVSNNVPNNNEYDQIYYLQVNQSKCHVCHSCAEVCPTGIINGKDKTPNTKHTIHHYDACVNCGQCLVNCPYGAIQEEVSFIRDIEKAINDKNKTVVAMPAPAVRYAIGEAFGYEPGFNTAGKMFSALRELGFDIIWDNEFAADLTVIEEGTELIHRITGKINKPLPQFTSCCPAWIKYIESFHPELIPHLSTCKSPIGMLGALAKTYGAKKINKNPQNIYTVSIMPCIAKKFEGLKPELSSSRYRDIDATINTRELAYMIKKAKIDYKNLNDTEADPFLGISTGAATIFGVSGGVMEAALRFAYEAVSGKILHTVEFESVRGEKGIREASVKINGHVLNVCVVSGLKNAQPIIEMATKGNSKYHFIEVMTCPGGCINGGGQPLDPDNSFIL
ncbi:TPA: 4Fe-4S dicluster domain-containing protein [bacterium]|nr:4Fe-4S dicluster domain-containing protein [bacterium]